MEAPLGDVEERHERVAAEFFKGPPGRPRPVVRAFVLTSLTLREPEMMEREIFC